MGAKVHGKRDQQLGTQEERQTPESAKAQETARANGTTAGGKGYLRADNEYLKIESLGCRAGSSGKARQSDRVAIISELRRKNVLPLPLRISNNPRGNIQLQERRRRGWTGCDTWRARNSQNLRMRKVNNQAEFEYEMSKMLSDDEKHKIGFNQSGSQKYHCRICGKTYTPDPNLNGYPPEVRNWAIQLYLEGNCLRVLVDCSRSTRKALSTGSEPIQPICHKRVSLNVPKWLSWMRCSPLSARKKRNLHPDHRRS